MTDLIGALSDPADARVVQGAAGTLAAFNQAGILHATDVHVARRIGELSEVEDGEVLLALALAVRAPRLGHVCVNLREVRNSAISELEEPMDTEALPWPDSEAWIEQVGASALVGHGNPLRLEPPLLYLERYWEEERLVATEILRRAGQPAAQVDLQLLQSGLTRLFPSEDGPNLQRLAAAVVLVSRFSVIAGGPGTGKTTTIARVLALLDEQASALDFRPPLIALAAPTGRAAARLEEAVREEQARLNGGTSPAERRGMTLHRLLGWNPASQNRFRHDRFNRLPHDIVIVDEASMVPLWLMARLLESVRDEARVVLVGDPEQLASVEAGAVLGDIVGPARFALHISNRAQNALASAAGERASDAAADSSGTFEETQHDEAEETTSIGDGIIVLRRGHRFGAEIENLADAIRRGDEVAALSILESKTSVIEWLHTTSTFEDEDVLASLERLALDAARPLVDAARSGDAAAALSILRRFRLLCAHRRGPAGAETWSHRVESWLFATVGNMQEDGAWYVGRPLLVTANDYTIPLYNGDTGVIVAEERLVAAFDQDGAVVKVAPFRLSNVETAFATTVHKAQGSQFGVVAIVLPSADSPILSRELLYTAVTRARERVVVAGSEEAIRAAVRRPIARASGLQARLWNK